jgi:hypothetical protein
MNLQARKLSVLPVVQWMYQAVLVTKGIRAMVKPVVPAFQEHFLMERNAIHANSAPPMLTRAESVLLAAQQTQQYACVTLDITVMASSVLHAKHVIPMLRWSKHVWREVLPTKLNAFAMLVITGMDCLAGILKIVYF